MRLKNLERGWRKFWITLLTRLLDAPVNEPLPNWDAGPVRVLFLRHDRIGDMIVSTGILRAIGHSHPAVLLDVLASPANAPVLAAESCIRSVVVFDKQRPLSYLAASRRLRRARYDVVIDCMVTAPSLTTLLLMLVSGARHRVGIAGRGLESILTVSVPPRDGDGHMVDQLATLAIPFGVDVEHTDVHPRIELTDRERAQGRAAWEAAGDAPQFRFLVNVSSGTPTRRWPDDHFVAAIEHVRKLNPSMRVVVIGGPLEKERAMAIASRADARYVATNGVREAFALVAAADVVFTPDTSIGHAASAFRKPVVVMFVRGAAARWAPYHTAARVIECADDTLENLPLAPVLAALGEHVAACG